MALVLKEKESLRYFFKIIHIFRSTKAIIGNYLTSIYMNECWKGVNDLLS